MTGVVVSHLAQDSARRIYRCPFHGSYLARVRSGIECHATALRPHVKPQSRLDAAEMSVKTCLSSSEEDFLSFIVPLQYPAIAKSKKMQQNPTRKTSVVSILRPRLAFHASNLFKFLCGLTNISDTALREILRLFSRFQRKS